MGPTSKLSKKQRRRQRNRIANTANITAEAADGEDVVREVCSVVAIAQQQAHASIQHASNQTKPEEATTRTAKQEKATAALLVALDSRNVGDIAEALERWAGDADSATVARVRA